MDHLRNDFSTPNLSVDPVLKEKAEELLSRLGLPISTAVNLFLNQVVTKGELPFDVTITEVPDSVNADLMAREEFIEKLKRGIDDTEAGRFQDASEFRKEFLESRGFYGV